MGGRNVKLILNKSGMGNINPRIPIPYVWFQILGFSEEEYEAEIILDEEKKEIIVKKIK
ncbi:MAG: hypothetical protein HFJ30_00410 [Clostridia bacterium]|nr:hypothetical protein [Clostridia bacterium]